MHQKFISMRTVFQALKVKSNYWWDLYYLAYEVKSMKDVYFQWLYEAWRENKKTQAGTISIIRLPQ